MNLINSLIICNNIIKIISYYSFVGDTVLDPFFGSGTTGLSCKKYNRKCIGFEIHSKYIDMFKNEIEKITSYELKKELTLEKKDYENLTKEECIKKLSKNPKKMLYDIVKKTEKDIKQSVSKKILADKMYTILTTS